MRAFNRFAVTFGLALVSTLTQAVEFSFASGTAPRQTNGNFYTATDLATGLALTATAWSDTKTVKNKPNEFETAALTFTSGSGMGVCNSTEGFNCTASNFDNALGNTGTSDLILFTFTQAVRFESLTLQQLGSNSGLSLWAGTGAFSLKKQTVAYLGPENLIGTTAGFVSDIKTVSLAVNTGSYDWLAVAARMGQKNDLAKLMSLTVQVNPVAQPVPDAATWMTMLAGLGLVGFAVNRRTQT